MKLDQKKFARQKGIIDTWQNNNFRGTLEAVTRFGKTFVGIIACKRLLRDKPDAIIYVCVPTDYLRDKWRETLRQFKVPAVVDTVHNFVKISVEADLLILDELHMFVGETAKVFPGVFETIKASRILGLTATLGEDGIDIDLVNEHCPVIDTVTMEEALREGYISDYIQYNYGINLSEEERAEYNKINEKFYKYASTFNKSSMTNLEVEFHQKYGSGFDLAKACLDRDENKELYVVKEFCRLRGWDEGIIYNHALGYFREMRRRKEYLYSARSKVRVAKEIIELFPERKFITFSQTTEPADELAELLPDAESYHSNLNTVLFDKDSMEKVGEKKGSKYLLYNTDELLTWKQVKQCRPNTTRYGEKRLSKYILDRFISGEVRTLCTAKKLDVGLDFDDIDTSITMSGTSKFRQNVQRIGRALNKIEGKLAIIIQLYIRDTQDEKWLDKRQTNMSNIVDITDISQIQT